MAKLDDYQIENKPGGGGFATSNKTAPESMSLSLNLVKSMP